VAGLHAAVAVLAALARRDARPDGAGSTVEVAQLEATVAVVGHAMADAQLAGREPAAPGNRHPWAAPQGVYRCRGDDRWLALTVLDDAGWSGLCRLAGLPGHMAIWGRAERRAAHDALDGLLSAWTADLDARATAARLQAVGVAAAPVCDAADVMDDPHLRARDAFVEVHHPEAGTHPWPRLPARLSASPAHYRRPAPLLGQHNHEVLALWAGCTPAEVEALHAAGVIASAPPT
jgi:benzylsuccinate CoA-transferase BbsF subunit